VVDTHLLPRPVSPQPQTLAVQVALAPAFTPAADLAWQTVTHVELPPTSPRPLRQPLRAQLGPVFLDGLEMPAQIRPLSSLPALLSGYGPADITAADLSLSLAAQPVLSGRSTLVAAEQAPFLLAQEVEVAVENGRFYLTAQYPGQGARCGWLRPVSDVCVLGQVAVSGVPLPEGAVNFNDQIALLDIEVEPTRLPAGGLLDVVLHWQGLVPMAEDYTVFVQVLDAQDRIVGQVDAWPRQGTFPTGQWPAGERVRDPYRIQLDGDLPPGDYRLQVGWYLLANLRRLPVLDADGMPVDDKVVYPGLRVDE
jgi:hypothetical protein